MAKPIVALAALAALFALSACATKHYGRQGELTEFERTSMTCREIELESAKVHGFLRHVDKESEFSGRSVLSFLGDFGIGNTIEKSSAIESANKRLDQLQQARAQQNCANMSTSTQPATTAPAAPAASQAVAGKTS